MSEVDLFMDMAARKSGSLSVRLYLGFFHMASVSVGGERGAIKLYGEA